MEIKKYLDDIQKLRQELKNKSVEKEILEESNIPITNITNRMNDILNEITDRIELIECIPDVIDYDMFHLHYVQGLNWQKVSLKLNICYQAVCKRRQKVYPVLQNILDERLKEEGSAE